VADIGLARLLRPRSIAVFGGKWALEVVRQCRKIGFGGAVWPVHPDKAEVEGYPCFRSVADLPAAPDAAFVGVNRNATIEVMAALAARGAGGAVCFAAGFREAGADGGSLHDRLLEAAGGMPFLGPNCYGLLNYLDGALLWPDQHGGERVERGVAIVSQSGNVGLNLTMQARGLPLGYLCTLGNQAHVGFSALVEALLDDARVSAIGLLMEAFDDVAAFERVALRARARGVPLVAYKLGTSAQGAAAALSHTASITGAHAAVDAFFRRLGVARARSLPAFVETLKLLAAFGPLPGREIASMSCSGGEAAMMADALEGRALLARPFTDAERARVQATLDDLVHVANPLDYHTFIWGDEARLAATYGAVMQAGFDLSLLVLDFPRADRCSDADWRTCVRALAAARRRAGGRAALVATLPECMPEPLAKEAASLGLVALSGVGEALDAIEAAALGEAVRAPAPAPIVAPKIKAGEPRALDEWTAKRRLAAYGLAVPVGRLVATAEDGAAAAAAIGPPVAVKAASASILHKTEADAVRLGCRTPAEAAAAIRDMSGLADRFLVEAMIADPVAELIVGVKRDAQLGPVLVVGAGGVLVELIQDSRSLLLPAREDEVRGAILGLRAAPLLAGLRGRPAGDIEAAVAAVMAVARFAADHAETLLELDVNPLLVLPAGAGAVAVDALIRIVENETDAR
jgi:acyl-CoA synthetase (NDP forming)